MNWCQVCFQQKQNNISNCGNGNICYQCCFIYLKTVICHQQLSKLTCPFAPIHFHDIQFFQKYLNKQAIYKLYQIKTINFLQKDPECYWCSGCSNFYYIKNIQCVVACQQCGYFLLKSELGYFAILKNKIYSILSELKKLYSCNQCPQCEASIQKIQGCPVMTCKCKTQFCWQCKRNKLNGLKLYCNKYTCILITVIKYMYIILSLTSLCLSFLSIQIWDRFTAKIVYLVYPIIICLIATFFNIAGTISFLDGSKYKLNLIISCSIIGCYLNLHYVSMIVKLLCMEWLIVGICIIKKSLYRNWYFFIK